jgi:hypothetical protein
LHGTGNGRSGKSPGYMVPVATSSGPRIVEGISVIAKSAASPACRVTNVDIGSDGQNHGGSHSILEPSADKFPSPLAAAPDNPIPPLRILAPEKWPFRPSLRRSVGLAGGRRYFRGSDGRGNKEKYRSGQERPVRSEHEAGFPVQKMKPFAQVKSGTTRTSPSEAASAACAGFQRGLPQPLKRRTPRS